MSLFTDKYDLIVIGGGPAGSVAAWTAAKGGLKTLLLEKDRDIGIPVRCAEGVSLKSISAFIDPSPKFIDNYSNNIRFIAPNGTLLPIYLGKEPGAILNRKVFDFELARRAAEAGAQIYTRCCATGLERDNGTITVKFEHFARAYSVKAPLVIGADGVETMVGRWAGLKTMMPLIDIETCFQYVLYHKSIERDFIDFYFGTKIAPGGYVWIFPKGDGLANVGLGINGAKAKDKPAKAYLDEFIAWRFPGASIMSSAAGSVPSAKVPKKMVADGVMLVGDAARQANPVSGGGIATGMYAGKFAGETAILAAEKGDFSAKVLEHYTDLWNERLGKEHNRFYRLKNAVINLSDESLNKAAAVLEKVPYNERSLVKVFQTTLIHEPSLMLDIIKAFIIS